MWTRLLWRSSMPAWTRKTKHSRGWSEPMMPTLRVYFITKILPSLTDCGQIRASPTSSGGWGLRREPGKTSSSRFLICLQANTVTAGSPLGIAQATTGNNVSTDQFSNFPTRRTVQELYTVSPSVTRSGILDATGPIVILRSPALPERRIATFWMGSAFRMQLLEAEAQASPLNFMDLLSRFSL